MLCLLKKYGIQQDGGVGAIQKMRKTEYNQFLLIKLSIE